MLEFECFIFALLDLPVLYPIGAASFFVFMLCLIAAIILWPLPPIKE